MSPKIISDTRIRAMHADGATNSAIAEDARISVSAVSQRLKKLGLPANGQGNIRNSDREQKPADAETRVLPWLPGYSIGRDGSVFSELGKVPKKMTPKVTGGMLRYKLSTSQGLKWVYAAVLVAEAWIGPRGEGEVVQYVDGDRLNIAVENLTWGRRLRKRIVSDEEFVRVWQAASSAMEVAEITGVSPATATTKAGEFRRLGIPLKKMVKARQAEMDIEALKRLAQESLGD